MNRLFRSSTGNDYVKFNRKWRQNQRERKMDWSKGEGDKKYVWGEQETMMILGEGMVEV